VRYAHMFTMTDYRIIKTLRSERKVSQCELADLIGVDRSTVSRIENGQIPSGPARRLLDMWMQSTPPAESAGQAEAS